MSLIIKPLMAVLASDADITPVPTPRRKTIITPGVTPPAPFSLISFSGDITFPDLNKPFWRITWATQPESPGHPLRGPCGVHMKFMESPYVQSWPPAVRLVDDLNNCYIRTWGGDTLVAGAWMCEYSTGQERFYFGLARVVSFHHTDRDVLTKDISYWYEQIGLRDWHLAEGKEEFESKFGFAGRVFDEVEARLEMFMDVPVTSC